MKDNKVIELKEPVTIDDPITELIRVGAQKLLAEALEIELFIERYKSLRLADGRQRVVRNGFHEKREIQTGVGMVGVQVPRANDRQKGKTGEERIQFQSLLVPPYLKRTKSVEELLSWLYLKGISTGDFSEALQALLGKNAPGLSSATISRLKEKWQGEYKNWRKRDLRKSHYVYWWVDGIYCNVRMDEEKQCLLVIIGATKDGRKELIVLEDGYRESGQSWMEVFLELKSRGPNHFPEIAVGDGVLGFWKALRQVFPQTREQRCWMHKTGNILNKMPKSSQARAKEKIQDIWMAETKEQAQKAFDLFIRTYQAKYPKAVECLQKDQGTLFTFYDFPPEHWRHLRTTNPIESTFATVRLRTSKVRGCFSRTTVLTMAFKLIQSAQKRWIRLHGYQRLALVTEGIEFIDGIAKEDINQAA